MKSAEELRTAVRCCHDIEGYSCGDQCPYWGTCKVDNPGEPLARDLEEIINLEIRMKPIGRKGRWFTSPACSACRKAFPTGTKPKRCPECGQGVNWDDD